MKTEIYADYIAFLNRQDKTLNGVTAEFAKEHKNYKTQNKTNSGCFNCSDCSGCSYCRSCSGCSYCNDCRGCSGCSYCSDCNDCSDCSDCSYCRSCRSCSDCSYCKGCSDCSYCRGCKNKNGNAESSVEIGAGFTVPIIPNIHQKVLEAVTPPENTLQMGDWHTCETTHCRAGWVVHLAGEAGYLLEKQTDTAFAAMQIYKASSPIHIPPTRFYGDNETAFKDIQRCAQEEINLKDLGVRK